MPTTATKQGITMPTMGDPPQIPADLMSLWEETIKRAIPRYANTAARDAELGLTPTAPQMAITTDTNTLWIYVTSWIPIWRGNGVYRREVLTGTSVITAAGGVTLGNRIAVIDHGADGSKAITLAIEASNAPYTAGVGSAAWGTVAAGLIPTQRTPVNFAHSTNMGLGQIDTAGALTFRWGTFGSAGSTAVAATAAYVIPAP